MKKSTEKTLCSTPVFEVSEKRFETGSQGQSFTYSVISAPDWVNILAVTPDHQIILVRQFRPGTEEFTLELPAGVIDPGESPLGAAQRELREETGMESNHWTSLGRCSSNPALMNNHTHLFLAESVMNVADPIPEESGSLDILMVSEEEFLDILRTEKLDHAIALATISRWFLLKKILPDS